MALPSAKAKIIRLPQTPQLSAALVFVLILVLKYSLIAIFALAPRLMAILALAPLLVWFYLPRQRQVREQDNARGCVEKAGGYTRIEPGFASDILDGQYMLECLLEEDPEREERLYRVRSIRAHDLIRLEAKEHTLVGVPKPLQESRRRNLKRNMRRLVKQGIFVAKVQHKGKTFLVYMGEPTQLEGGGKDIL